MGICIQPICPKKEAIEALVSITLNDMLFDKEGNAVKELGVLYYQRVTTSVEELDRLEKKEKEMEKKEKEKKEKSVRNTK